MAWKESFIYTWNVLPLSGGTTNANPSASTFTDHNIRIDSDADFEIIRAVANATDPRIYARIRDDAAGRQIHRGTLDLRAACGFASTATNANPSLTSGFQSFVWPQPYLVAAASALTASMSDFSGSDNTVRWSLQGNKVRQGVPPWQQRKYKAKIPFSYPVDVEALAGNANTVANIPMDIDSDFLVQKITASYTGAATIILRDGGRDRQWMDRAVHIDTITGSGSNPCILTSPRFIYRGSQITVDVSDLSGSTNTIRLQFWGVKLYG